MTVKLNASGEGHLRSLIDAGKYNASASWSFSAADGNALLGAKGDDWSRYASVHLGEDTAATSDTEERWKYPAAKASGSGEEVYRSGLIAAKQRAAQQGIGAIENAAGKLVDLIDAKEGKGKSARAELGFGGRSLSSLLANAPKNLAFEPGARALAAWESGVHNASSDEGTISILDAIGSGMFGGGVTAKSVSSQLKTIGKNPVTVEINSPGGDLFEGLAIFNLLREHPKKVTVKVMGVAASAAAVVAMAGDKVQVPRAGFLMIHNVWVVAMGNANDLRSIADSLLPFDAVLADIFAMRSGMSTDKVKQMLDAETWIGGTEAVDLGLADSLLPSDEERAPTKNEIVDGPRAAMREIDKGLAAGGMPRAQRRFLFKQFNGTPGAADDGTPSAAEPAALSGTARLRLSLLNLNMDTESNG